MGEVIDPLPRITKSKSQKVLVPILQKSKFFKLKRKKHPILKSKIDKILTTNKDHKEKNKRHLISSI